jgi:hypothetical protein
LRERRERSTYLSGLARIHHPLLLLLLLLLLLKQLSFHQWCCIYK